MSLSVCRERSEALLPGAQQWNKRNGQELMPRKFPLDMRKNFLCSDCALNRLPREQESPSLETFQSCVGIMLCHVSGLSWLSREVGSGDPLWSFQPDPSCETTSARCLAPGRVVGGGAVASSAAALPGEAWPGSGSEECRAQHLLPPLLRQTLSPWPAS